MIYDKRLHISEYVHKLPALDKVAAFIQNNDLSQLPLGKINIDGEDLFLMIFEYSTQSASSPFRFESHKVYADLHLINGTELIYVPQNNNFTPTEKYDADKDVEFVSSNQADAIVMNNDTFLLLEPGEPHLTGCNVAHEIKVRKYVFKLKFAKYK